MIRFLLKAEPPVRVGVEMLKPETLAGLSQSEIERLPVMVGNRREALGAWFRVEMGEAGTVEIEGSCRRLDFIGAGMRQGELRVTGDAGAYLGRAMSGGRLLVQGSAGFGAATALTGGEVRISGDAGDGLAGSLPGAVAGMAGGTVIVEGIAGTGVAQRLKRGLVVISRAAGPLCGAGMIAGTVIVGGRLGPLLGVGMRRGSILALGGAEGVGSTFADCGAHDLAWLRLLKRHLNASGLAGLADRIGSLRRFAGDLAVGGKGELLIP